MKTLKSFIRENKVRITSEYASKNPNMDGSENMDNYKVKLFAGKRRMTIFFSKGHGHNGVEPKADEVLDCLASDSSGVENVQSFEEWARDYGYDTDSRKAEKIFKTCESQAKKLKKFLGSDVYSVLLWETERL